MTEAQKYPKYMGMSYEQASREAKCLIHRIGWCKAWDRLSYLKDVMTRHLEHDTAEQR